jgi:hypothetical protein
MDQYCTIKISALNSMKHIGHSIKIKSESIQMKFFLLLYCCSPCEAFSDDKGNNTTLSFSVVYVFDPV